MHDPKAYRTEVHCDNDGYNDVPSIVEFNIDAATAAEIVRLSGIVKSNDLLRVIKFDFRARYLRFDPEQDADEAMLAGEDNEFRTEADVLNINNTEFWFSAYIKHTEIRTQSERQRIDELVQYFGWQSVNPPSTESL